MKITPPCEKMTEREHEAALAAFLEFQQRLDARLSELGSPHVTEHCQALLFDYGRGLLPLIPTCALLLEMLEVFALNHFSDTRYIQVCPTVARKLWFEECAA